jgi:hypothetical protein
MRTRSTAATTINQRTPMKRFFQQAVVILLVYAQVLPALAQVTTINTGNMTLTPTAPAAPVTTAPLIVSNVNTSVPWGQVGNVTSKCGGIRPDGTFQPECPPEPAIFMGESSGLCPAGTFASPGTKTCWSCPAGYIRSAYPISGPRACYKADPSVKAVTSPATFLSKKFCPAGSFWDAFEEGMCWSCPDGYRRSATLITAPDACIAGTGGNRLETFAEVVKDAGCRPGEIFDPRNGGECWACPTGQLRQVAFPITGPNACGAPAGIAFAEATDQGPRMCGPGQIFDNARTTNGHVAERVRKQFDYNVPPEIAATLGTPKGTCWTCPLGAKRRADPIWSDKACYGQSLGIVPAGYVQPGLFRLDGAEDVALAVIRERKSIERIATTFAETAQKSSAEMIAATWNEIKTRPQSSTILLLAVYERVEAALETPQSATPAEARLVASLAGSLQRYRTYLAQTALDSFDIYEQAQTHYRGQRDGSTLNSAMALGQKPDFERISVEAVVGAQGASWPASAFLGSVLLNPGFRKKVLPFKKKAAEKGAKQAVEEGLEKAAKEALEKLAKKVGTTVAGKVAETIAAGALGAGILVAFSAGPQIIVGLVAELIQLGAEQAFAAAMARPKLLAKLSAAKAPVDLVRMYATEKGEYEVSHHWTLATPGEVAPVRLAEFVTAVNLSIAARAAEAAANAPRFSIQAKSGQCLNPGANGSVGVSACGATTRWVYVTGNALQLSGTTQCLTVGADNTSVALATCATPTQTSQSWQNTNQGWITSTSAQRCLETAANGGVTLKPCNARTPLQAEQLWSIVR